VSGLEVTANNPADTTVDISPGIAIDPDGNIIIMPNKQRYRLQTQEKGLLYLIIQFREIPGEPYQPSEGGQPTRILEAYRIQERNQPSSEPYVELARIDWDPSHGAVKDARNPATPMQNEINLNFREEAIKETTKEVSIQSQEVINRPEEVVSSPTRQVSPAIETMAIGCVTLGGARSLHSRGLKNLIKSINREHSFLASLEEVDLRGPLNSFKLLYLTGNNRFDLNEEQQKALRAYLHSGGVIFGEGCSDTSRGTDSRGAKEFGLSFNRYASLFNCKLEIVQRGHSILSTKYIFAETPQGCEPGMLLEGGHMIYGGSDYGCAWDGGHPDQSLDRDIIRSAFEVGENIISYAWEMSNKH
jgi:hypothetical protein